MAPAANLQKVCIWSGPYYSLQKDIQPRPRVEMKIHLSLKMTPLAYPEEAQLLEYCFFNQQ